MNPSVKIFAGTGSTELAEKIGMPLKTVYTKAQQEKFPWAMASKSFSFTALAETGVEENDKGEDDSENEENDDASEDEQSPLTSQQNAQAAQSSTPATLPPSNPSRNLNLIDDDE